MITHTTVNDNREIHIHFVTDKKCGISNVGASESPFRKCVLSMEDIIKY